MNTILLSLSLSFLSTALYAQKKSDLFLTGEFGKTAGASIVYNHFITMKGGLGIGIEQIDFRETDIIHPSIFADLRFYFSTGKATFIPLAQLGYNISNYGSQAYGVTTSLKGGVHAAFGLGYSYAVLKNDGGPYAALCIRAIEFISKGGSGTSTVEKSEMEPRPVLSIGFRF